MGKGSVMGIGPCILTKVCCAPFMGDARWVIGWAMVGRAEFAYLIAQMAAAGSMIDEKAFSICIWALLYSTVLGPIVFVRVLDRFLKREGNPRHPDASSFDDAGSEVVSPKSPQDDDGIRSGQPAQEETKP